MVKIKGAVVAAILVAVLPACKIVKTPTAEERAAAAAKNAFDPAAKVEAIWDSQAIPYLDKRAGDLKEVVQLAASGLDQAGQKYGNPRKQATSPWTYAVKFTGKIVAADTQSRAATIDIDSDGDGKADARVQVGPAIRGTALRDTLDFVDFNAFKNQIEWAQFGKAFNEKVDASVLAPIRANMTAGKTVTGVGAFPMPSSGQLPLITPSSLTLGQ
jgi:predicted lipoprotein